MERVKNVFSYLAYAAFGLGYYSFYFGMICLKAKYAEKKGGF